MAVFVSSSGGSGGSTVLVSENASPAFTDNITGTIAASTHIITLKARRAFTILRLVSKLGAGTCTLAVNIDGVNVTGLTGIAQGTTEISTTATALNTVAVDQTVNLVITSPTTASNLTYQLDVDFGDSVGGAVAFTQVTGKPLLVTSVGTPGSDFSYPTEKGVRDSLNKLKVCGFSFVIEAGTAKEYIISTDWPIDVACTINKITTKSTSGTATGDFKINATSITGASAVAISSTEVETTPSAANVLAQGDSLSLTLSAIGTPVDIVVTVRYTRSV